MATRKKAAKTASDKAAKPAVTRGKLGFCSTPEVPDRVLPSGINPNRASLILNGGKKWTNGTQLHYYFLRQELGR